MDISFFSLVLVGLFSSFVGTLAGGGGLISLPAMMIIGIPVQLGIATNKFSSGVAAFTSVLYLLKNKEFTIKTIIMHVVIAFLGGCLGAIITSHLTEDTMNIVALVLLIFALFVAIRNKRWFHYTKESRKMNPFLNASIQFFIAVYDGGFGPGSSTFGIIHYMNQNHVYMKAVQLTRVLILGSCIGAFLVFYQTGFVQWNYAIAMAIGSIIGSQIGLITLPKVSVKVAQVLLVVILVFLITEVVLKIV
ncbi:MAG: sulfite exporter TauE/SafE family protein [Bacillaceae bacterium]